MEPTSPETLILLVVTWRGPIITRFIGNRCEDNMEMLHFVGNRFHSDYDLFGEKKEY